MEDSWDSGCWCAGGGRRCCVQMDRRRTAAATDAVDGLTSSSCGLNCWRPYLAADIRHQNWARGASSRQSGDADSVRAGLLPITAASASQVSRTLRKVGAGWTDHAKRPGRM